MVLRREETAEQGLNPKQIEESRRCDCAREAGRIALVAQRIVIESPERELGERRRVLLEVQVLAEVARQLGHPDLGEGVVDLHELPGLVKRQRPDHERVEH